MVSPCLTLRWRTLCFAGCGRFGVGADGAVSLADQLLALIFAAPESCERTLVGLPAWTHTSGGKRANVQRLSVTLSS